ncbi:hypothetical protein [Nostoc sp.]|uniref:hypothetical protein n=1 Tax=Nostoc sp. TaxID=1180 RepID=UPI003FA58D49
MGVPEVSVSAQTEVQPEEDYSSSLIPGEASADFMVKQHQQEQVRLSGRFPNHHLLILI